jgi:hypothetical protein
MQQIMMMLCEDDGLPTVKLHGLADAGAREHIPLSSADSAMVPADLADRAARKSAAQQFIHGGDPARVGTTDLVLAKADGDIEAGLKMFGELGGVLDSPFVRL